MHRHSLLLLLAIGLATATRSTVAREPAYGRRADRDRAWLCHTDENGDSHVIVVNAKAVPAHLAHGDVLLVDADGDGYVAAENACVPGGDCDDNDPSVHPGATEWCDGKDNDCSGLTDDGIGVIGTQAADILRDPTRLRESAMGNLVADALHAAYPGVDAAIMNSGGLRADLRFAPPSAGENPGEILCSEIWSVLPFGNEAVILTLTGAQLEQAFLNGFSPACGPFIPTGRFPQVSGLRVEYACNGPAPIILGMWKTPGGLGGPQVPIGPMDLVRFVTNDFMATGGDNYSVFLQGADVVWTGDDLLMSLSEYLMANSPVAPVVEGRIVRVP